MGIIAKIFPLVGSALVLLSGMRGCMVDQDDIDIETPGGGAVIAKVVVKFPPVLRAGPDRVVVAQVLAENHTVSSHELFIDFFDDELGPIFIETDTNVDPVHAALLESALITAGLYDPVKHDLFFVQSVDEVCAFGSIEVISSFTVVHAARAAVTFDRLTFVAAGQADLNTGQPLDPAKALFVDFGLAIPTVSGWGLIIVALLLLVAAKIYFGRRRAVVVS